MIAAGQDLLTKLYSAIMVSLGIVKIRDMLYTIPLALRQVLRKQV